MEAMRRRLGPFEVPLDQGKALDSPASDQGQLYRFKILKPNEKLLLQAECTLRYSGGEALVTITAINQAEITLRSKRNIALNYHDYTLLIYPWFLYEKLKLALESLPTSDDFYVPHALLLFGQGQAHRTPRSLQAEHTELNTGQRKALQLCSDSNLAFVWGPPGTGKTTTLSHIVTELLSQGQRILLTSTTNAAVDQALVKLAALPQMQKVFAQGQVVRIGQTNGIGLTNAETFRASLSQVVRQLNTKTQAQLEQLRERRQQASRQKKRSDLILKKLRTDTQPLQLDLFREVKSETITIRDLRPLFSEKLAHTILGLSATQQQELLGRRRQRLETVEELSRQKMAQLSRELSRQETTVVQNAQVILATMTNVYLSGLLNPERFDTVIVEEAGMAILPTLFYCAALARTKVVIVGDPQQLPPIVQSRDEYVQRAMGRNIFEVAAQKSLTAETMVMLDVQYRMHPLIGNLVSKLFYEGKLRHDKNTSERDQIAGKRPYPGSPLLVIDTEGQTTCATEENGFSRLNEKTAQLCVELALEAVRSGVDSVAIITPYIAQSRLIRQRLSRFQREANRIECRTVHRFQGGERDIVILDTVDTVPLSPGILLADHSPASSSSNLINVSLSRARGKLIIISDVSYFKRNSPHSIINDMLDQAMQTGVRVSL